MMTKSAMWKTVAARRQGDFIYAVRTTGIYCRPGCASRLPLQNNVEFYLQAAAAARAGYRPCKRCAPDKPPSTMPTFIVDACNFLQQAASGESANEDAMHSSESKSNLSMLAARAELSERHFHRLFKMHVGITPLQYLQALRGRHWREHLGKAARVTDAIYDAGFNSSGRAYENPAADLGMTPGAYQNGGVGMKIFRAVVRTSLGFLLVAATSRGICMMEFGDSEKELQLRLRKRFSRAVFVDSNAAFKRQLLQVTSMVENARTTNSKQSAKSSADKNALPLDIRGTAFQVQVWQALRQIPIGQTTTYSALAKKIGNPRAARAVAAGCAANPVAVVVPCHRVIGKNGDLRGYRWGINRKRILLEKEGALPNSISNLTPIANQINKKH